MNLTKTALAAAAAFTMLTATAHANPIDQATATIEKQANNYPGSRDNRISWAIFHWTNTHIRSERATRIPPKQWNTDINDAIRLRAGACGTATVIALTIADRLGVKARPVEFYYTETDGSTGSHIMPEFYIDGGWRLMDVLWHTVYRSPTTSHLLSAREVFSMPLASALRRQHTFPDEGRELYTRGASPWIVPHDPFRYLSDPQSEMTINDHGTVALNRTGTSFQPIPNRLSYIGRYATIGQRTSDIKFRLTGKQFTNVTVHLSATCPASTITARSQITATAPIQAAGDTVVTLPAQGTSVVLSMSDSGLCSARIDRVD